MKLFLIALLVFVAGCCVGHIEAKAVDGTLRGLISRHQAYVEADTTLIDLERDIDLRDGELMLKVLDEAQKNR